MFAYVDPKIARFLKETGRLFTIDVEGHRVADDEVTEERRISLVGPIPVPVEVEGHDRPRVFRWYAFVRRSALGQIEEIVDALHREGPKELWRLLTSSMAVNSIFLFGDFERAAAPLTRIHSCCLTGDTIGSMRCECGPQLHAALRMIADEGCGALVYMAGHEGRGIGLWAKAITYLLQDAGQDTYQANEKLGLPTDSRDFTDAAAVLHYFRRSSAAIRLLSNNPLKRSDLVRGGIEVVEQLPLLAGVGPHNVRYMEAKREHGHAIPADVLAPIPHRPVPVPPAEGAEEEE
jgi:GTP cyclohydrolase II